MDFPREEAGVGEREFCVCLQRGAENRGVGSPFSLLESPLAFAGLRKE